MPNGAAMGNLLAWFIGASILTASLLAPAASAVSGPVEMLSVHVGAGFGSGEPYADSAFWTQVAASALGTALVEGILALL